ARLVAPARAGVRLEHPQRPQRGLSLGRRELDQLPRRLPAPLRAAHSQARRELGMRRTLAGPRSAERGGDGAGDGLELVVATLPDEVVLDVTQARLEARGVLQDGAVPEQRARRILPRRRVEDGQTLVRLAPRARVLGALGGGEGLLREPRHVSPTKLRPLARDASEGCLGRRRGLGAAEGPLLVAGALVLLRRLQEEERACVPRGL